MRNYWPKRIGKGGSFMTDQNDGLKEYRNLLVEAERQAQESFDKTVLSLSGGALAISFAFITDVIGDDPIRNPVFLILAWLSWGLSLTFILSSFYFSQRAFRYAVGQVDRNEVYDQNVIGGKSARLTQWLNGLAGLLFIVGVICISFFVSFNLN